MILVSSHVEREEIPAEGGSPKSYRDAIALKPIAFDRGNGLRRITNSLTASGDAAFTVGVSELLDFRLDARLAGKSPLFYFGKGQSRVTMALIGANNVVGAVSNNTVTFPNAWNNIDLVYTVAGHRVQERILLRKGHPSKFSFMINEHVGFNPETLTFGNDFRILEPVLESPDRSPELNVPLKWIVLQQGGKWQLDCVLPGGDYTGWVVDPTLTLQPDASDGIDTLLYSYSPTENYGAYIEVQIGEGNWGVNAFTRTLIKFDLTALLGNAVITSAILSLYCLTDYSNNARTFRVYRQKRAWLEGTRTSGVDDPPTGATWLRYDTTNNWQTAGGFGADDCEQTDIGSRAFTATETLNEFKDFSLTPTTKAALDLGNGWLIKADTELDDQYLFASSDYAADPALRPKLVINYTLAAVGGGARRMLMGVGR